MLSKSHGYSFESTEQVSLSFDFAFEITKLDDGELHFKIKPDDSEYNFEVKGKASVHADNVLVGTGN